MAAKKLNGVASKSMDNIVVADVGDEPNTSHGRDSHKNLIRNISDSKDSGLAGDETFQQREEQQNIHDGSQNNIGLNASEAPSASSSSTTTTVTATSLAAVHANKDVGDQDNQNDSDFVEMSTEQQRLQQQQDYEQAAASPASQSQLDQHGTAAISASTATNNQPNSSSSQSDSNETPVEQKKNILNKSDKIYKKAANVKSSSMAKGGYNVEKSAKSSTSLLGKLFAKVKVTTTSKSSSLHGKSKSMKVSSGDKDGPVLKKIDYNLSYRKEKRQHHRSKISTGKKLLTDVVLLKDDQGVAVHETVDEFIEAMKMFGVMFTFDDNKIETFMLDGPKVTFVDELRDKERIQITTEVHKLLTENCSPSTFPVDSIQRAFKPLIDKNLEKSTKLSSSSSDNRLLLSSGTAKSFFGTRLEDLEKSGSGFTILKYLIDHIANHCDVEGIFRIAGTRARTNQLKKEIDKLYALSSATEVNDLACDLFGNNVYTPTDLATVLKVFLRELPEPLIPQSFAELFLQVPQSMPRMSEQIKTLNLLVLGLPQAHCRTLRMILRLLNKCAANESSNKMSIESISLIVSPNIFPDLDDPIHELANSSDNSRKSSENSKLNPIEILNESNFANFMGRTNNTFATVCLLINLVDILFHVPLDLYKNVKSTTTN